MVNGTGPEDAAEAMGWLADSVLKCRSCNMGSTREEVLERLIERGVTCHYVSWFM
jgi:hypothetical protein